MIEDLTGVTSKLVSVALDAALLRHELIANNIANSSTPGYQAKRLSFEEHLAGFTNALTRGDDSSLNARIESVSASLQQGNSVVVTEGGAVELDREMVKVTENTLRYQSLLKTANEQFELLRLAINGGRS